MLKNTLSPKYQLKYDRSNIITHKILPNNFKDFAELCTIRSGASKSGICKFKLYPYQEEVIDSVIKYPTTVIGKCRQLGISELLACYSLFRASTEEGFLSAFFSLTSIESSMIAKRVRRMISGLEDDGYLTTTNDNLCDIQIERNSCSMGRLLFRNSSENGVRGIPSVNLIVFDELAFLKGAHEIVKSSLPATAMLGDRARVCMISTPNGQSGFFYDRLNSNNKDDFLTTCEQMRNSTIDGYQQWLDTTGQVSKILIHWRTHPIYSQDQNYLKTTQERFELTDDTLAQEFDLSFLDSQNLVFNSGLVRKASIGHWEISQKDTVCFAGLDPNFGGSDYCVLTIIKEIENDEGIKVYSLVDWYRARKKTNQYNLFQISEMLNKWNPICTAVESNSGGAVYLEQLSEQHLNLDFKKITTTSSSKPVMVNRLLLAMESERLTFPPDKYLIEEFLSYQQTGTKLEAIQGKTDDAISSLMFAVQASPLGY